MRFALTPEQEELRRTARRFLEKHASPRRGPDEQAWRMAARDLGWAALIVPEALGGAGLGQVELALVMEETGRALFASPLFATVMGTQALLLAASAEQKREWLPVIAAGERTATLALAGDVAFDGAALTGTKTLVPDGHTADLLVVAAGDALVVVDGAAKGVERRALPTMDATRPLAEVRFSGARGVRIGDAGALARTLDRACVALASEQVGTAEKCLEMALDYAKVRTQFGRPIGSFQAIKHKLADMLVDVETARSASRWAAWVAENDQAQLPLAAPLAKAYCTDALFRCASESIQVHGGIGFTWDHDAHLYFKRAKSSESLLGDATLHREAIARRLEL